jgi:hypothetical protein
MSLNLVQLASDNFTRANENPLSDGGLWAAPISPSVGMQVISNLCQSAASSPSVEAAQYFNGAPLPADQYASFTIATISQNGEGVTMWVRATGNYVGRPEAGYFLSVGASDPELNEPAAYDLSLINGDTFVSLASDNVNVTVSEGDVWTLAVAGSNFYIIQNGNIVGFAIDSTLSSGGTFYDLVYAGAQDSLRLSNVAIGFIPSISGNAGVAGAVVSYSGTEFGSVVAASGGAYSISGLPAGSYSISAALSGYSFSPSPQNVTLGSANLSVNFTATPIATPTTRFNFIERPSATPGEALYDVVDSGASKLVGQLFFDAIVTQAWSFNLRDNQPFIAAGSSDALDIENFATSLPTPSGVTIAQPGPTPSTRFRFGAVQRRSGQPVLEYLVSDGPSSAYGSIGSVIWDGVFERFCFKLTNASTQINSPADVACITTFAASLALISPNQISL